MRAHAMTAASLGLSIVVVAAAPIPAQTLTERRLRYARTKNERRQGHGQDGRQSACEQLRQHPAQPSKLAERVAGLYMIDIATGEVTLIADQPDANTTFCGSAAWSSDGKPDLFDAMRTEEAARAAESDRARRRKVDRHRSRSWQLPDPIAVGRPDRVSPQSRRRARRPGGIWAMQANGSGRHRLGSWGRPRWSPDGRQFVVADFAVPAHVSLVDVGSEQRRPVQIGSGMKFWSRRSG